ncbi:MAG TPA: alanyl-tRNA editing protein, partial [Acidimicrobiales bacterium]|nr:alanyl-tRNA editing protein [Acidimicrobiales bacterium]
NVGASVAGVINQERRHHMMRTHTAMHILCGVMWQRWQRVVTGGNMDALSGRMDFELDEFPQGFIEEVENLCNAEIAADRPVEVSFLARSDAVLDRDLIRTKVNLIPDSVTDIRVVDIVGLDKQADGGTHVASTSEVGRIEITKTESKGRGFKRVRFVVHDG